MLVLFIRNFIRQWASLVWFQQLPDTWKWNEDCCVSVFCMQHDCTDMCTLCYGLLWWCFHTEDCWGWAALLVCFKRVSMEDPGSGWHVSKFVFSETECWFVICWNKLHLWHYNEFININWEKKFNKTTLVSPMSKGFFIVSSWTIS